MNIQKKERIKVIHKSNGDLSDARNTGLSIAKVSIFTLLTVMIILKKTQLVVL